MVIKKIKSVIMMSLLAIACAQPLQAGFFDLFSTKKISDFFNYFDFNKMSKLEIAAGTTSIIALITGLIWGYKKLVVKESKNDPLVEQPHNQQGQVLLAPYSSHSTNSKSSAYEAAVNSPIYKERLAQADQEKSERENKKQEAQERQQRQAVIDKQRKEQEQRDRQEKDNNDLRSRSSSATPVDQSIHINRQNERAEIQRKKEEQERQQRQADIEEQRKQQAQREQQQRNKQEDDWIHRGARKNNIFPD